MSFEFPVKGTPLRRCLIALAAFLIFNSQLSTAQNFRWDLRFDTKFDNREYDSVEYLGTMPSVTFFSARIAPAVGMEFDGRHRVMAGVSYTLDMGASVSSDRPEPLLYYNYRTDEYGVWAGRFERRHLTGIYSRAIYAGSHTFYDNVIDGMALQYLGRKGSGRTRLELVLDWDSKASVTRRESFRVLSAGEFNPFARGAWRWLTASYSLDVYHLATRTGASDDGVIDHVLLDASAGAALERVLPWFERFTMKVGRTNAFDRDRKTRQGWLTPGGVSAEVTIQKKKIGVRNMFYRGGLLMPLWHAYGNRIYKGDPFFAASRLNNYTMVYWHPRLADGAVLRLELGMHTDGRNVGLQQVAWIGISLDDSFFRKKQ